MYSNGLKFILDNTPHTTTVLCQDIGKDVETHAPTDQAQIQMNEGDVAHLSGSISDLAVSDALKADANDRSALLWHHKLFSFIFVLSKLML